ncbi:MAG: glutamate mutase L, partial [Candidatus Aminicenantales bacterium]
MSPKLLLSVDIGSTYTKGGLFALEGEELRLVGREVVPTTVDHLGRGFTQVREAVLSRHANRGHNTNFPFSGTKGASPALSIPVYWSSSARGGLKIAA